MRERIPDVLVIGGGPAGLATAIGARRIGLDVRLIEAAEPPIDKACGEGLMPDGVAILDRLGVSIPAERRHPIRGIRWLDDEVEAAAAFPGPSGWGVRRLDLHRALQARAEAVGVELCWGVSARGLEAGAVRTSHGPARGRWLVAADGLRSPLRRAAGLEGGPGRRARFGLRRHYALAPWSDHVEVHWSDGAEAYVTPLRGDLVGIVMLYEGAKTSFDALLERFPPLRRRLAGAPLASSERGAGPLEQRARAVVRGNLALVGDAAGYVDAITGEGTALAFHQAVAVVEAVARGDLALYAAAHRRLVRLPDGLTRLLLVAERRPRLRRRLMRALAGDRPLFESLLGLHVRSRPLVPDGALAAARLAWRLARAPGAPAARVPPGQ